MTPDEVRAEWDAAAATFDDEPDHGLHDPEVRAAWRELLVGVLPPAPARVADLGCGTGTLSVLLAEQGYAVTGRDMSPRMIDLARAKAAAVGLTIDLAVGDAAAPDLGAASVDVVVARHVVWALPDPAAALARWWSLLAPGGRLVLVEGRWHTGAGLAAAELLALLPPGAHAEAIALTDPALWGGPIGDERYLLVAAR